MVYLELTLMRSSCQCLSMFCGWFLVLQLQSGRLGCVQLCLHFDTPTCPTFCDMGMQIAHVTLSKLLPFMLGNLLFLGYHKLICDLNCVHRKYRRCSKAAVVCSVQVFYRHELSNLAPQRCASFGTLLWPGSIYAFVTRHEQEWKL